MRISLTIPVVCLCIYAVVCAAAPLTPGDEPVGRLGPEERFSLLQRLREQEAAGYASTADSELRREYINTLKSLGYHDLVAEQYERMLQKRPEDPALLRALGEAWMHAGPYGRDKAFDALKRALTLDADDNETCILMAHLLHREGLFKEAEAHYDKVLSRDPEHVRARLGKAVLMARTGDIVEASALFDNIGVAAQIYDVETRIMLRKALFTYERRGGWFEDNAANHAAYARLLYRAGRITDALPAARRAVKHDPNDYQTWNFIAAMSMQLGNLEHAEQSYGKSLEANPDQPVIHESRRQLINEITLRRQDKAP